MRLIKNATNYFRSAVFSRDNYTCQVCGATFSGHQLSADHIVPIYVGGNEWDLANLQTLCRGCHSIKTREDLRFYGRKNYCCICGHPKSGDHELGFHIWTQVLIRGSVQSIYSRSSAAGKCMRDGCGCTKFIADIGERTPLIMVGLGI